MTVLLKAKTNKPNILSFCIKNNKTKNDNNIARLPHENFVSTSLINIVLRVNPYVNISVY